MTDQLALIKTDRAREKAQYEYEIRQLTRQLETRDQDSQTVISIAIYL